MTSRPAQSIKSQNPFSDDEDDDDFIDEVSTQNVKPTTTKQALFDINDTPCKLYDKISSTFTFLDTEISKICETFENRIYSAICMYGERPIKQDQKEDEDKEQLNEGQAEYIFPKREDKKPFRLIWSLQKKCPIIEAYSHVYCYVYKFLSDVCPLSKKHSLDPAEPDTFLKRYVAEQDDLIGKYDFYQSYFAYQ
ncbi:hypothetical protein IMG5_060900 [Ichthyophthirius multifiliis]|uniref:WASH complex subunit 4 N-terminal domain-containing protein n=1 Tax=Ichthyophthirius multifiliis TaxID=5932 RepID=G0QNR0_ICHMU|nr:hypothetical protein IMG5_060900 [Ichthyophthirius multifiliis]EGR33140.1 hypothetical protein IMG5_060900 [Ichthyophthirius multifiliis]|eukprot:XP_004037126.1 hypothetical protein IMG5_060900 [Ichthyophthirius multifiliis]